MPLKTPLEEYEEFLSTCPTWFRSHWCGEPVGIADYQELAATALQDIESLEERLFKLLAQLPQQRKECEARMGRNYIRYRVKVAKGRPRQDKKAEEIARLRAEKMTYGQISPKVKTSAEEDPPSPDSLRKLLASRQSKSTGEKSD